MSSLIVEVCRVEEVACHPNANRLERIRVKNWWCIAVKGQYTIGDSVVYFPPDSIIPEETAERWGIAKYCSPLAKGPDGQRPPGLRIRANRFLGEPSFGTVQNPDDANWPVGLDVCEHYKVTKWEPPVKCLEGDAASPVHAFHAYTSIENIGNFPGVFVDGEQVVVTEKLHGSNSRVGYIFHADQEHEGFTWQWMAGSHSTRRKETNDKGQKSKYWFPFSVGATEGSEPPLQRLLQEIKTKEDAQSGVIIFGEIFGPGIQDMSYGQKGMSYRVFDISVDGKYLSWNKVLEYTSNYSEMGIKTVPVLYSAAFSMKQMDALVDGPTVVATPEQIRDVFKGREGIVIKPLTERFLPNLGSSGRVILKYISVDYHDRRNPNRTEDH